MKKNIKNIVAVTLVAAITMSSSYTGFATQYLSSPTVKSNSAANTKKTENEKQILTIESAIKSAVSNNLNLVRYEINRESILKELDSTYEYDKSIFETKAWQERNLENLTGDAYNKAKQEMEQAFVKAMSQSDVVTARLVNQRGTIDIGKLMERESVGITVNRLFTSIMQKEKDLEVLKRQVEQDKKNTLLYQKQFDLGKISESKLTELAIESKKNQNNLKIEQTRLNGYYAELENITQISGIKSKYTLEKPTINYVPLDFSEDTQRMHQERAVQYNMQVVSKVSEAKIKASVYDNYPYVEEQSTYNKVSDEKHLAELEESQAKRDARYNAQVKYNNLQEIQENIELAKKNIQKMEVQQKDLTAKYKQGLVSKNAYENSLFGIDQAKNSLEGLYIQHYQLRIMFENPYFAGQ